MLSKQVCEQCLGWSNLHERLWRRDCVVQCPYSRKQLNFSDMVKAKKNNEIIRMQYLSTHDDAPDKCPFKLEHLVME